MAAPILIIGAGGHASVVIDAAHAAGADVLGIIDADPSTKHSELSGVSILGDELVLYDQHPSQVLLAMGIGSVGSNAHRREIFERYQSQGYSFATIIHPEAIVSDHTDIGSGSVIMAGSILQPYSKIGENVIINSGAQVDHHCTVSDHVHIAPGAVLSGNVHVGVGAHIGPGSTVIQGISISPGAICGAGSVVINDVPEHFTVVGNPAKER